MKRVIHSLPRSMSQHQEAVAPFVGDKAKRPNTSPFHPPQKAQLFNAVISSQSSRKPCHPATLSLAHSRWFAGKEPTDWQ